MADVSASRRRKAEATAVLIMLGLREVTRSAGWPQARDAREFFPVDLHLRLPSRGFMR